MSALGTPARRLNRFSLRASRPARRFFAHPVVQMWLSGLVVAAAVIALGTIVAWPDREAAADRLDWAQARDIEQTPEVQRAWSALMKATQRKLPSIARQDIQNWLMQLNGWLTLVDREISRRLDQDETGEEMDRAQRKNADSWNRLLQTALTEDGEGAGIKAARNYIQASDNWSEGDTLAGALRELETWLAETDDAASPQTASSEAALAELIARAPAEVIVFLHLAMGAEIEFALARRDHVEELADAYIQRFLRAATQTRTARPPGGTDTHGAPETDRRQAGAPAANNAPHDQDRTLLRRQGQQPHAMARPQQSKESRAKRLRTASSANAGISLPDRRPSRGLPTPGMTHRALTDRMAQAHLRTDRTPNRIVVESKRRAARGKKKPSRKARLARVWDHQDYEITRVVRNGQKSYLVRTRPIAFSRPTFAQAYRDAKLYHRTLYGRH